ncbi:MAG TPA: sigma factor [Chloroflexia bacterium]|nr:sigma factor [Chloroflexia bacterium]
MDEDLRTLDDSGLAARMAAGDTRAVAVLYDRYATPAFSLALKLAGDPQRAADLVQRAFTRVWADARRFDPTAGHFAPWLLSIVNYLGAPPALAPAPVPVASRSTTTTRPLCPAAVTGRRD